MSANTAADEVSVVALMNVVLRYRRLVVACALGLPLLVGLVAVVKKPVYTSGAAFVPQARRGSSNLAGLAAQFGFAVPGADPSQSPQFYSDLMGSHSMLGTLVDASYDVATDTGRARGTLVDIFETTGATPAIRREKTITELQKVLAVTPMAKTSVVRFTVSTRSRDLSKEICERMLAELNRFNLATRISQATAERQFTEKRLASSRDELSRAEDELRAFQQNNRGLGGAPGLVLQQERLQREVTLHQTIYTTLAQAYEQARIEEVRDTPVLSVLEAPYPPVLRDPRGLTVKLFAAFVIGGFLGVLCAFVRDRNSRRDSSSDDSREFTELGRATLADLRAPWRLLRSRREHQSPPVA